MVMTPKEIQQLIQQSPALRDVLATNKATVWTFLREKVRLTPVWGNEHTQTVQTIIGPAVMVMPHMEQCPKCEQEYPHDAFVVSPYSCPSADLEYPIVYAGMQWCIDCTLQAFLTHEDTYDQKQIDALNESNFQGIPEGVWWS